jgi:hypothetical protein
MNFFNDGTGQTDDPVANRNIFIPKRKGSVFDDLR